MQNNGSTVSRALWEAVQAAVSAPTVNELQLRLSPGFIVSFAEGAMSVPLRAFTSIDGFGRLGCFLVFSDHAGAEALRPVARTYGCSEKPLELVGKSPGESVFDYLTEPLHDPKDRSRAGAAVVAIKPRSILAALVMTKVGLARAAGWRSAQRAEMSELLGVTGWTRWQPEPEPEPEPDA